MAVSSLLRLLFFFILFKIFVDGQCLDDQKKLLLELRSEFKFNSSIPFTIANWDETGDCCKWNNVGCDYSGHVTSLLFYHQGISGKIGESSAFFRLTYLSKLQLSYNDFTTSEIPNQFHRLPNLSYLYMKSSGFKGPIPSTLGNLTELVELYLSSNFLTGSIPSFHNCKNLEYIDLSHNNLMGSLSHLHFQGLKSLYFLNLGYNSLNGTIPNHLFALPSVFTLDLSNNQFSGPIKEISIVDNFNLYWLDLSDNRIGGPIPNFFFQFENMSSLKLSNNLFNGTFKLNKIQSLTRLSELRLSSNNLSVDTTNMSSSSHLKRLHLSSCNLYDFPDLRNLSHLSKLDLSNNLLRGDIPSWIWETEKSYLNLSFNSLTGLENPPISPNFNNSILLLTNNQLTRVILTFFCNFNAFSLNVLDLSFNNLSGTIPPCLIKKNLVTEVLNLGGNKISGVIPDHFSSGCSLETFDVSNNNLGGKVPKSLANCKKLEVMNVGNNNLKDIFPCILPLSLRILVLRSNRFHGHLRCHKHWSDLQILDISSNDFGGRLNLLRLSSLRGMMLEGPTHASNNFLGESIYYHNEVDLTVKGNEVKLVKIWSDFTCIDLSSNRFHGEIPYAIGNLSSLYILNLSHNSLTDAIPRSLGALTQLESLDLSSNKLTGRIPDELTKLDFLSFLNLSYNHLTGPIPTSSHFQTFSADSFEGNAGLSGYPLNGSFNNHRPPGPSQPDDSKPKYEEIEWGYVFAALGYVVAFGSIAWTLICWKSLRERYFEKIEEVVDKMFYERGRRRRHERRVRSREERRNGLRRHHHQ